MNGWVFINGEWRYYPDLGVQRRLCLENLMRVLPNSNERMLVAAKWYEMRQFIGECKVLTLKQQEYDNG